MPYHGPIMNDGFAYDTNGNIHWLIPEGCYGPVGGSVDLNIDIEMPWFIPTGRAIFLIEG